MFPNVSPVPARTNSGILTVWLGRIVQSLWSSEKTVRAILGVPNYEAYVERLAAIDPSAIPIARAEFAAQCLESRFNRPGSRCC
ncbi:MAG: YbdD/YjiX family protein [Anaerolineae bacterium]|nr:YbdD/YjiX family protein [Gemmatimonadaceae bacterium]